MRIVSLALVALFAVTSVAPLAAEEQAATFIKRPKVLGTKESTVTVYRAPDSASSGPHINCSGRCFSNGGTHYWTCKGTHADVMCHLSCSPPPPKPGCLPF
jgi:hypothetical protein